VEVEVVLDEAPGHDPDLVLRSKYLLVRALLVIATTAVVALSVVVAILAGAGDEGGAAGSVKPLDTIDYGGFNPNTGRPESAPLPH
jgi:hypothetical protein